MYPEKIVHCILEEHVRKLLPYNGECEYQLEYRSKDKDRPWGVATIYHPPLTKNHKKNQRIGKRWLRFP